MSVRHIVLAASCLILAIASIGVIRLNIGGLDSAAQAASNAAAPAAAQEPDPTTDSDFSVSVTKWQPPDESKNSNKGHRETWLAECRSGGVNFAATEGWCYSSDLKMYYNVKKGMLLSPLSGRIFTFDGKLKKLHEMKRTVDEQVEPPNFRQAAGKPRKTLTRGCDAQDTQAVNKHLAGLNANLNRADSQQMKDYFTGQIQFWTALCHG